MPTRHTTQLDVITTSKRIRDAKRRHAGSARHAVPQLFEGVGDANRRHLDIMPRDRSSRGGMVRIMAPLSALRDRRVLVTGGAGFLGRVVVRQLHECGADVIAPRSSEYDLTLADAADDMLADHRPDVVVHLAARVGGIGYNQAEPALLYLSNLLMGTYVIEATRRAGTDKTVVVGTVCSYPKITPVPFNEASLWDGYPEETNAPYGIAKKALLVHAQVNAAQYGQRFAYLIPTNLYGPGDKFHPAISHVIPALIKKCVDATNNGDASIPVWGTGRASREYLYVEDAARGIVRATEVHVGADPINLGTDREVTIKETVETIARLVGFSGELAWDPTKPDGQPRRRVDAGRARELLGWSADTDFEVGLRTTIDWYLAHRDDAEQPPH
jgi:GDP-L-fucose synthase